MALAEGAALGILARQADAAAFQQQCAERERLAGRPIDALAGVEHGLFGFELTGDLGVQVEAGGHPGQRARRSASTSRPGRRSGLLGMFEFCFAPAWKPAQWPSSQSALFGL